MRTFSGKRGTLALAIAGIRSMSGWIVVPQAQASAFDDSTLTGGIYYWQRGRDRKNVTDTAANIKLTFLMRHGTLTLDFPVWLRCRICSVWISRRLPR